MFLKAEIIVEHDDLHRTIWRFSFIDSQGVHLDEWRNETRATKRHKFQASQFNRTAWIRATGACRDNRIERPSVPLNIRQQALEQIRDQIQFKYEEDR